MYELLSRYYDIIHASLTVDREYILGLARVTGGPVLELGCGTGRLLLPLARSGFLVTGIDNSPEMLAIARDHLQQEERDVRQRITLVEADIKELTFQKVGKQFPLIMLPYNTLLHFQPVEIRQLLQNAANLLEPKGRLFIDLTNPFIIDEGANDPERVLEHEYIDPETGETIRQMSQSWLDASEQCLHTTWTFAVEAGVAQDTSMTSIDFDYWYQYPHQLEMLLRRSGYRIERMMGAYDESPFNEDSERLLIVARPISRLPGDSQHD